MEADGDEVGRGSPGKLVSKAQLIHTGDWHPAGKVEWVAMVVVAEGAGKLCSGILHVCPSPLFVIQKVKKKLSLLDKDFKP